MGVARALAGFAVAGLLALASTSVLHDRADGVAGPADAAPAAAPHASRGGTDSGSPPAASEAGPQATNLSDEWDDEGKAAASVFASPKEMIAKKKAQFGRPVTSEWEHERSGSGNGNSEEVDAKFKAIHRGKSWKSSCVGEVETTNHDGDTEKSPVRGKVAPQNFVPKAPLKPERGAEIALPDWEVWSGCGGSRDVHYMTVEGRSTREFHINGKDVRVSAWKAVVPESERGWGDGEYYWDSATGLLLESRVGGVGGGATTTLTRTGEALAYR